MLKRKQIMISDWLDDYIHEIRKVYDVSYSEIVRVILAYGLAQVASQIYNEKEFPIDVKRMANASIELNGGKIDVEANRKLTADIYFEAREVIIDATNRLKTVDRTSKRFKIPTSRIK